MNYEGVYQRLIDKARARGLARSSGYDIHHIIPKSMGGTNEKDNLIKVTPKEHYIAHVLLYKIHGTDKTMFAINRMANSAGKYRCGAMLSYVKNKHRKLVSENSIKNYSDMMPVRRVSDGVAVLVKQSEYKENRDLYVGLNKGKKNLSAVKKTTSIYKHSVTGECIQLEPTDPRVISGEYVGINKGNDALILKASLAGAAAVKALPWFKKPLIDKDAIKFALDVYDWFVVNYDPSRIKATGFAKCYRQLGLTCSKKYLNRLFDRYKDGFNPYDDTDFVEYVNELKENRNS